METIDKFQEDFNLKALEDQRSLVSSALLKANDALVSAKAFQKGKIKDSIRNYEQELKRLDRLINDYSKRIVKQDKIETKQTAYKSGIDPNASWADAVKSGLGSVSTAFTAAVSGIGLPGAKVKSTEETEPQDSTSPVTPPPAPQKNPLAIDGMPFYLAVAALVLYFVFKKK